MLANDSPHVSWQTLPLESVTLTHGFWAERQAVNRRVTLLHGYQMLEKTGSFDNFRLAGGTRTGEFQGREFSDSDVYKWLEAVAYELHNHPTDHLQAKANQIIALIAAAQRSDGYLNTYYQVVKPDQCWTNLDFGHELYCAGHLFQAAVAHYQATHTSILLDIATRFADYLCTIFGPKKRAGAPGHPEIELALIALYRLTGTVAYLELAAFFIDQRGQDKMRGLAGLGPAYHQDRIPVRQSSTVEGHAVRAMYLAAGVTDLYLETGEPVLLAALQRQWTDMVQGKMYLTGGLGSRQGGEAFGQAYELAPDQGYCETCAAIGSVMWNWRMLQATGEAHFAEVIERTLYNGFLSGLSFSGERFFYTSPLMSRTGHQRREWYGVACCPTNIMRLLASLGQLLATKDEAGLQIHLYDSATIKTELVDARPLALTMTTEYPWRGRVKLTITETDARPWQLRLRVPDWCKTIEVILNGQALVAPPVAQGYLVLERVWQPEDEVVLHLPLAPQFVEPHPRIDAVRNSLSIQRGPLVYCLEEIDSRVNLMDVWIDPTIPLQTIWDENLLGGVMVVVASGEVYDPTRWQAALYRPVADPPEAIPNTPLQLKLIPYYAWANRGPTPMRVWLPKV